MQVIQNKDGDFWSNDTGWTADLSTADKFTNDEARYLNLPIGGHWIDLSDVQPITKQPNPH